jgi:signal transduction histidine kinase
MILHNVSLALDLSPTPLWVHGDRIQLQQVLLNLIVNAMDAMKDMSSGNRKLALHTGPKQDRSVRVAVEDTGIGVPADSLERIFDRFVTTKPHGMGLGLAVCRSIIEAHGGHVGALNNPERGATFWFELPAAAKDAR